MNNKTRSGKGVNPVMQEIKNLYNSENANFPIAYEKSKK